MVIYYHNHHRLSDFLFTIARYSTVLDNSKEVIYINPTKQKKPNLEHKTQTFSEA